jgi:hypothetical protein
MPNHTLRIIIFIILGLGVLAASVGVYVVSSGTPFAKNGEIPIPSQTPRSSPSPTNNLIDMSEWEMYRSEEYGYQFRYPRAARVSESGISIKEYLNIPENLQKEIESIGYLFGIGVSIISDNIPIDGKNPCTWYFAERENLDIMDYDPAVCQNGATEFNGEPAYIHEQERDGTNDGLFATKSFTIVFFHEGRPWEIRYSGLPSNPSPQWQSHPYYAYLEQSVPITEAIISSFRFVE